MKKYLMPVLFPVMMFVMLMAFAQLTGCKAPVDIVTPDEFIYDVRYSDYFLGTGVDFGVEFDTDTYSCIDLFVYDKIDFTVSLGTCNPDIFTRVTATKER